MLYRLLLKFWFLPPMINIVAIVAGLFLLRRHKRTGITLCFAGLMSLWLLSTPYMANQLLLGIERSKAISPLMLPLIAAEKTELGNAAIVVLGSGHYSYMPEYGAPQPDLPALARLNYAAYLYRQTALPIMLTGGVSYGQGEVHAQILADYLQNQLQIQAQWLETRSHTTQQNADFAADILLPLGVNTVLLVTQSHHMRRSVQLFEQAGFTVMAAPTQLADPQMPVAAIEHWLPNAVDLSLSRSVMHEYLGLLWYNTF